MWFRAWGFGFRGSGISSHLATIAWLLGVEGLAAEELPSLSEQNIRE